MSHLNPGLISAYNSLTDKHLAGYFSNSRIRRHLQRAGLITRSGRIVPDKEYRQKLIQRAHQRHVRECLAQAIFHKVLEMERLHQIEIKRKLEEFARRERVHKIKVERSKRYEEEIIRLLSPRPPTGARGIRKQHSGPDGEHTESSESPGSSRPNTAPGKMQRPVRLKPLHSNSTAASLRHSSPYKRHDAANNDDRPFNGTMDKESRRRLNTMEVRNGLSPYCLPVINNFVTPVPPTTKRKERPLKVTTSGTLRGRRLRPTTASSGADVSEEPPMLRSSVPQSRVCVNMVYLGKSVHLSNDLPDLRDEIRVFQQHCGGENLCVYKGKLREGESFQFISRRHRGFPFSLTFFLNGLQVERLSSCCEFKHRKSSRLSGRHGHFAFGGIEAASPCYKCIIAMGLDKKPVPPPKRLKEDAVKAGIVPRLKVTAEVDTETTKEEEREECESSPVKDTEMTAKVDRPPEDHKIRDDYEEDFEADDEGPVEEESEKKSPRNETDQRGKHKDASESEEEDDAKSRSGSSLSGSDESDAEEVKDAKVEDEAEKLKYAPEEVEEEVQEENCTVGLEAAQASEAETAEAKHTEIQDSAGQSTEIEISDTSVPLGNENRVRSDTQAAGEGERRIDESKLEEPERAKSVQEKLADAILKNSHCSSEPELSDTSTETEESSANKSTGKETNVAEVVAETSTEQQEVIEEEKKCEETELVQEEVTLEDEMKEKPKEFAENDTLSEMVESEVAKDEKAGQTDVPEDTVEDVRTSDKPEAETEKDGEVTEQEAKSVQEDESAVSGLNNKPDETAEADNTELSTAETTETMEMKAQVSDTQEPISCEEAPAADTQTHDKDQGSLENREENEANAKDEIISDEAKEEKESVVANGEQEKEKLEDIGKAEKDNTEEQHKDSNEDEKDTTPEEGKANNMESKLQNENVEEMAVEEERTNLNTEGQEEDETDKTQSEKDSFEKPNENEDTDHLSLKGDVSKKKCDSEDETNTAKDEESHPTECEINKSKSEESEKQENIIAAQQTSADKESVEFSEEIVKSEATIEAEEATKEMLNNVTESEERSEKEVDAENGEVSVVTETKLSVERDENEQKEETEKANITNVSESETEKLDKSNDQEKAEVKSDNKGLDDDNEVTSVHSNQEEKVNPVEKEVDVTDDQTESHADHKPTSERVGADIFAGDSGENGDTEEASKASEEGASVLLKPQVKSPLQNDENREQKGSPEGLTTADSADLVTNWVTMHQTSKYFETFVEPLEDLRQVNSVTSNAQSLEPTSSESPVKMVPNGQATDVDKGNFTDNEAKDETSDIISNKTEAKQDESDKDEARSEESKVIIIPNAQEEDTLKETASGESVRSEENKTEQPTEGKKVGHVQLNNNITRSSIAGSHSSGKPEVSGNHNEEKSLGQNITLTAQTVTEVLLKTEERPEILSNVKSSEPAISEYVQDNSESKDGTVTTDITVSKSDNGSQEESYKEQEGSVNTEIGQSTDHTQSKEHLSRFSVDDTLFGRSGQALSVTKTESRH